MKHALSAIALCLASPALADDRPDFAGECHPPVLGVIDPDWRREAQRFKEASLKALSRYDGGEEGARQKLRAALQLAESTRASAYDVIQLTRELYLRGLRGKDLEALRGAALDAQASLGADGAARYLRAVLALRGKASIADADLKELDELLGRGLLREALGRRLGGRGAPDAQREVGEARLREGAIEGNLAAAAAGDALLRSVGQAQPGEAARAALVSCVATMSRTCPRKEAEEHCHSTPREYLELLSR